MSPGSKQQREERIVLLGAMGTGKSTLCKHLAVTAARTEVGPVPLLVRVRSWVERGFEGSVLDAAARSLAEQTGLPIAAAQLGHLCELGRVVMLVDGIDEGDGDLREQLNARLLGFATSHPRVTMIVTSRVHGYEGHALPPELFAHFGLELFDDPQLRSFVRKWYALVGDPGHARVNALIDALGKNKNKAAHELARTPLQTTLIAALHHARGVLPGRRSTLYDECLTLLVETWPKARGRELEPFPASWQLGALQILALWMHEHQSGPRRASVLVAEEVLVETMAKIIRVRVGGRPGNERRPEQLARRWLRWLVDTGVLVEDTHRIYGFAHRGFMEYLAGRGVIAKLRGADKLNAEGLAEQLAEHQRSPTTLSAPAQSSPAPTGPSSPPPWPSSSFASRPQGPLPESQSWPGGWAGR